MFLKELFYCTVAWGVGEEMHQIVGSSPTAK